MQFFEDVKEGSVNQSTETFMLTEDNLIAFCREWDPAPFHIDRKAAADSPMGKLFTSSVHLLSICMKLSHSLSDEAMAVVALLGTTDTKFHATGCAGDTFYLRSTVKDKRLSMSNPDRGILQCAMELINQRDEIVVSYLSSTMVLSRAPHSVRNS